MSKEEKIQRRNELSWALIRAKLTYYYPHLFEDHIVIKHSLLDSVYDTLDKEYLTLCKELDMNNTVSHNTYPGLEDVKGEGMFEVDLNRPSVKLVIRRLMDDDLDQEMRSRFHKG